MDYVAEAKELVRNLNQRMNPSAYDTAWLARLRTPDGDPRWPDLLDWLVENQKPDGSWGGEIVYYHDRILCTLTAIIALRENGHTRGTEEAIKRGERYLWHHLHLLPRDPFELSGFELIFPTLLEEARDLGLDVPTHTCGYGEIQTAKLRLIPPDLLYSSRISTVYSLEFLGRAGDPKRLAEALASNGSLGTSPATTAYYLSLNPRDEGAVRYLEQVREQVGHIVTVYPFRTFEAAWVLNNLSLSGRDVVEFADTEVFQELWERLGPHGAGMDPVFGVPDGDTTSVCCKVLLDAGFDVDASALASFEDERQHIFHTWDYERNVSVSTNVHALEALYRMEGYPNRKRARDNVVAMLLENRQYNIYWIDKWHASPYYVTSHALVALMRDEPFVRHACSYTYDWISHTQRDDGGWGFFERSTPEETAYALTALLHRNFHERVDGDILVRGVEYLANVYPSLESQYCDLWIAKCLFTPYDVVKAAVLAALILYDDMIGL